MLGLKMFLVATKFKISALLPSTKISSNTSKSAYVFKETTFNCYSFATQMTMPNLDIFAG